jgi:hypothetical protein
MQHMAEKGEVQGQTRVLGIKGLGEKGGAVEFSHITSRWPVVSSWEQLEEPGKAMAV